MNDSDDNNNDDTNEYNNNDNTFIKMNIFISIIQENFTDKKISGDLKQTNKTYVFLSLFLNYCQKLSISKFKNEAF